MTSRARAPPSAIGRLVGAVALDLSEYRTIGDDEGHVEPVRLTWLDHHEVETSMFGLAFVGANGIAIRLRFRDPSHATICANALMAKD
jgi:hypothetical protein